MMTKIRCKQHVNYWGTVARDWCPYAGCKTCAKIWILAKRNVKRG